MANEVLKHIIQKTLKIIFPFVLGGGILYWMYRDMDFNEIRDVMLHQMRWEWMILSFVPGVLAQVFRALRWRQSLEPLGERPRVSSCIHSIFLSYASSLVVPRSGEFLRCGVLTREDGTPFSKALGTVVTERAVDIVMMLLLFLVVFMLQIPVFKEFFSTTGVSFQSVMARYTSTGIFVTLLCGVCALVLMAVLWHRLAFSHKVRDVMHGLAEGLLSIKKIRNIPLYIIYSVGIWVAYFFHYYLTFFCFNFTENLGMMAALVSFCVGTVAVIVPTPNGAGPWHFAVKTILTKSYGLAETSANIFALIVHTVQTLLLVVLGMYSMLALMWHKRNKRKDF